MGILRQKFMYVLCFLLTVEVSCGLVRDLKNFTLYNKTSRVDSNKLKINGIYYSVQKEGNVECFVLYQNGTYLNLNGTKINSDVASAIESLLQHNRNFQKTFSTQISKWGAFEVVSDTLLIQSFHHPASSEVFFTTVFNYNMKILNDTTLVEMRYGYNNSRKYYLYKTQSKPDSVNLFHTNKRIKSKLDKLYEKRKCKQ